MSVQCAYTLPEQNRQCKRRVKNGEYCHAHISHGPAQKPDKKQAEKKTKKEKADEKKGATSVALCPVCLEDNIEVLRFSCGHDLCPDCRDQLRQALCPLCRKDIHAELNKNEKKALAKYQKDDSLERTRRNEEEARLLQERQIRLLEQQIVARLSGVGRQRRARGRRQVNAGDALRQILVHIF